MSLPPPTDNYIGEPQYPSPWTTKKPREGLRDTDAARIVSLAPDVCKTPIGSSTPPIPYPVVDYCGHDESYTPSVRFTSQKAMVMRSNTTHVHGDAPGTACGIKSGAVGKRCHPIEHADQVRAEGSHVIRHLDRFHMNDRNTEGEAIFVRDTKTYEAPKDDDPVPGSLVMTDWTEPVILGAQYAQAPLSPQTAPLQFPPSNNPTPQPFDPSKLPPAANDNKFQQRGSFGRSMPGLGLAGMADVLSDYGTMNRLRWLNGGLSAEGISVDWNDPQELYALNTYSENLGGISIFKRTFFPPMTEPEARAQLQEQLAQIRQRKQQQQAPAQVPNPTVHPIPLPQTGTTRVDEDGEWPCLVGPYWLIQPLCPGEAHHIVPDMTFRLGTRPELIDEMRSTAERVPNSPTFSEGMSICLTEAMHGSGPTGLHGKLRVELNSLGSNNVPNGTAPMGQILEKSLQSIDDIPGLSTECKERAKAAATEQVTSRHKPTQPGRVWQRPLPTGRAYDVLKAGSY